MAIKQLLLSFFLFNVLFCFAQQADSLEKPESYYRLQYDNDFFSATDRYYTQGARNELILPVFRYSPLSKILFTLKGATKNYYGMAIHREGFTPRSIRHNELYVGERPYACVSMISGFLVSLDNVKHRRLTTQLSLGIIGPAAKGETEQKTIHRWLNNIQPLGWQYQIANDAVINYDINYEKGITLKKHAEMIAFCNARVGTLYDNIGGGLLFRAGRLNPYFETYGLFKHSGAGKKFRCTIFAKGEIKAVGYNATLQGGLFNRSSIYTISDNDVCRVVVITSGGIILSYKRFSLEYTKVYITPEFKNGLDHGWGQCVVMFCF